MTSLRVLATATVLVAALLAGGCVVPFDGDGGSSTPAGATSTPTAEATSIPTTETTPTPTTETTPTPTTEATPSPPPAAHEGYDQTTVTVLDAETDEELGTVEAAIADDRSLRETGLSETDELPDDRGMVFTYDSESDHTYVMRNMSFGIDIVYVGGNGTITSIHHAPAPGPDEDGNSQHYPGTGQYVLEVNYAWTAERGIEVGDSVEFGSVE